MTQLPPNSSTSGFWQSTTGLQTQGNHSCYRFIWAFILREFMPACMRMYPGLNDVHISIVLRVLYLVWSLLWGAMDYFSYTKYLWCLCVCVLPVLKMLSLTKRYWKSQSRTGYPPFVRFCCYGEYTSAYLSSAVYGIGPLLDAPQPDFAMPFNVLTLTCSLIAFFVTTIISILVRKSGGKSERAEKLNALLARWRKLSSSVLPVQQQGKEKAE